MAKDVRKAVANRVPGSAAHAAPQVQSVPSGYKKKFSPSERETIEAKRKAMRERLFAAG